MGDSLRRTYAIAYNTFIEAVRNRAFITLLILAVLFVVFSIALSGLAVADQQIRVLKDFGLFSVSTLSIIISIVMGSILIYKEIEKKTFYVILTKPIRRLEVIIGKYFGLLAILAILNAILTSAWVISLAAKGGGFSIEYLKSATLIFFETAIITSVVIFFSSFSTPITSGVLAGGVFVVG
ncbi:MAG: ABC transporter permease, partial [Deltaproteobacteria bacterium]|nr:ABC transporter permease [Deltaproteobacteria bacterium]